MKKTFIFIIIATLAITYFLLHKNTKKAGEGVVKEDSSTVTEDNFEESIKENIFQDITEEKYEESTESFFAEILYPSFGVDKIDREIKDFLMKDLNSFKENNDLTFNNQSAKNSYNVTYKISNTKDYQSLIFTIYEFTGGAHGNIRIKVLNYKNTGERIYLGSIFKPESDYLKRLSDTARAKLKESFKDLDESWIDDGTEPISSNFESFYFTEEDYLKIIFQPYQIGPWVIGTPEIEIKLTELSDILYVQY